MIQAEQESSGSILRLRLRPTQEGSLGALRRVALLLFLGILPALMVLRVTVPVWGGNGFDFHVFWQAGRDYLHGTSPYPAHSAAVIADKQNFLYPVWVAAAVTPLAVLPFTLAEVLFSGILIAALGLALYVLGIRDWRCYGAAFLSLAALSSLWVGALSPLLALAFALLWRYRGNRAVAVPVLAAFIAAKVFLWPVLVFFVATRRSRTALLACAGAIGVTLLAWARLGFAGLTDYPSLLSVVARVESGDSFSLTSLGLALGLPRSVAQTGSFVIGGVVVSAVLMAARRGSAERTIFVGALAAALILSPIVWGHYLLLLFIPIALVRPRFSPLWLLLVWIPPDNRHSTILLALGVLTITVAFWRTLRPEAGSTESRRVAVPAAATVLPRA